MSGGVLRQSVCRALTEACEGPPVWLKEDLRGPIWAGGQENGRREAVLVSLAEG